MVGKFKVLYNLEENSYENLLAFHERQPDLMEIEFSNTFKNRIYSAKR
jgi:hypothetical protein